MSRYQEEIEKLVAERDSTEATSLWNCLADVARRVALSRARQNGIDEHLAEDVAQGVISTLIVEGDILNLTVESEEHLKVLVGVITGRRIIDLRRQKKVDVHLDAVAERSKASDGTANVINTIDDEASIYSDILNLCGVSDSEILFIQEIQASTCTQIALKEGVEPSTITRRRDRILRRMRASKLNSMSPDERAEIVRRLMQMRPSSSYGSQ